MKLFKPLLTLLLLATLGVYLFVTAPPPLPETTTPAGERLPVRVLFDVLAAEQAAARGIFNAEIVTPASVPACASARSGKILLWKPGRCRRCCCAR